MHDSWHFYLPNYKSVTHPGGRGCIILTEIALETDNYGGD